MITNERQYKITRAEAAKFRGALEVAAERGPSASVHPRIHQAAQDGLRSQLEELEEQLHEYEELRAGRVHERTFHGLGELPMALIEGRIVAGLTQRALGERVHLAEQQIQRYEATCYAGVSIDRIQEIATVLHLRVELPVTYAERADSPALTE
jgi:hypothetical protein